MEGSAAFEKPEKTNNITAAITKTKTFFITSS
jgi:hypothetical protein